MTISVKDLFVEAIKRELFFRPEHVLQEVCLLFMCIGAIFVPLRFFFLVQMDPAAVRTKSAPRTVSVKQSVIELATVAEK